MRSRRSPRRSSRRCTGCSSAHAPELTGDISANGITMTGGGSLIWGFDKLIASKTGIPTRVADEAVSCVAYGTGNCLENLSKMQDGTMNLSRQRQMKAR